MCTDIYEIALTRDRLTVEDYKEYLPLRIASCRAWNKYSDYLWAEKKEKAEDYLRYHNELAKKIGLILNK